MSPKPRLALVVLCTALPTLSAASPDMECAAPSQAELASCLQAVEHTVDGVVETALGFAMTSAQELDDTTGRPVAVPALKAGQTAWNSYRDAHCDFVGSTYGGGSGTGIAIRSCRIELGRARARDLLSYAR